MNTNFVELNNSEAINVSGGGWLGVAGGALITAGTVVIGGPILAVGAGVLGGIGTIVTCWP